MDEQIQATAEAAEANAVCSEVSVEHLRPDSTQANDAIIKRWVEWAFVPSRRSHFFNSHAIKHDVERECQLWDVSERDIRRAMIEAGFKATKDGPYYYFYVVESLSRKTYHYESRGGQDETIPHPLHRLDPMTEYNKLPAAEQQRLRAWIDTHVSPRQRRTAAAWVMCEGCCEAAYDDHYAAFNGAMLAAGYQPVNPTAYYWEFRVAVDWSRGK